MTIRPYDNSEYLDWITAGNFLAETILEGADRVTLPTKMLIRDMAVLVADVAATAGFDGAIVSVQYSPDNMETKEEDLVPADMEWFVHVDGIFTAKAWENLDAAEGWIRMHIAGFGVGTDIKVSTRPRIEAVI